MNNLLVKKWYKVQLITKSKTFKITKQVFNTKAEGIEKGISKGYEILNLKALNKLLLEGWTEYQEKVKSVSETIVGFTNDTIDLTGNPEVEESIRQYHIKQLEKKGVQFVNCTHVKNEISEDVKKFLSNPPKQQSVEKFDYSKSNEKYFKSGEKQSLKALVKQRADYCNEVIEDATV